MELRSFEEQERDRDLDVDVDEDLTRFISDDCTAASANSHTTHLTGKTNLASHGFPQLLISIENISNKNSHSCYRKLQTGT